MSNFQQALNWLVLNQKVRRKHWRKSYYIQRNNNRIFNSFNEPHSFNIGSFYGEDWEIFEEEKIYNTIKDLINQFNIIKKKLENFHNYS